MPEIEINEKFKQALKIMEDYRDNVFITGKAGTGKSTLLNYFRKHTKKEVVVLAPTGVAAINIKGQTIHSFFGFKPDITLNKIKLASTKKRKIFKELEVIIIDEISMLRADLLDCIDKFLRLNGKHQNLAFGGIQMIFIGDLYQLPPVVTGNEKIILKDNYKSEYFFDAKLFNNQFEMKYIELEKIYRQKDQSFIKLLNTIRNNSITDEGFKSINQRYYPDYQENPRDFFIYLTPTNKASQVINEQKLKAIDSPIYTHEGIINGHFEDKYLPTEKILNLKIGAQVMMLNNNREQLWVNGTIGKIIEIEEKYFIKVKLESGNIVEVSPYTWEIFTFYYNETTGQIETNIIGSFTQYPIKLAWSVTIHKSQGKTFNKVIIDIGRGTFSHGQIYVALSRCTSLKGIILKKEIAKKHIWMDYRVVKFITQYQYKISDQILSLNKKIEIIKQTIKNQEQLEIIYLKANDTKSRRIIMPIFIGQLEYAGKPFLGIEAYCLKKNENRVFRVDRILEISPTNKNEIDNYL